MLHVPRATRVLAAIGAAAGLALAGAAQPASAAAAFGDSQGHNHHTVLQLFLADTDSDPALDEIARGWVDQTGHFPPENGMIPGSNYIVGVCGAPCGDTVDHRDVFAFDLSGITDTIVGAALLLDEPADGLLGEGPITYVNWDVSTPVGELGQGGRGLFNDLGSGVQFASTVIDASANGATLDIQLNSAGIAALNAARGRDFAIGGAVAGDVPAGGVPEPATWALMLGGFGLAGAALRRRRVAAA